MAVQIECEICHHRFPAKPEYFGKQVFCPSCGASLALAAKAQSREAISASVANQRALPFAPPPPLFLRQAPVPPIGPTATSPLDAVQYAGFWIRVVALLIDTVVLLIPNIILATVIPLLGPLALHLIYKALCLANWNGQTIGKKACGIKVVDRNLGPVSMGQAFGRTAAEYLSGLILGIGYIMVAFRPRKQALHDDLASTLHVYA